MRSLLVVRRPTIGIAFLYEHIVELCHLVNIQIGLLATLATRDRNQRVVLVGERVLILSEIALTDALIPHHSTGTEIHTPCGIGNLTYQPAVFNGAILHHVVPLVYDVLIHLEAFYIASILQKGVECPLVVLSRTYPILFLHPGNDALPDSDKGFAHLAVGLCTSQIGLDEVEGQCLGLTQLDHLFPITIQYALPFLIYRHQEATCVSHTAYLIEVLLFLIGHTCQLEV